MARVVYVGANGTELFVRALDALEPVSIAKSAPRNPFVSPDGQWVGFADNNIALKKVAITGGPPVTLASLDGAPRGATWAPGDTIIFGTSNPPTGLLRVAAGGGTPIVLTRPDRAQGELDHSWPEMLPGGRAVLFTIIATTGGLDAAQVAVLDLQGGTVLVRGGNLAPTGALMRVGVERSESWEATAPARLLNEGYFTVPGGNAGRTYDISPDGQRFLMIKAGGGSDPAAPPPSLVVVQHWGEELKRLVPER